MPHVVLATYATELEAHLARATLEAAGIKSTVHRISRYRSFSGGAYHLKVDPAAQNRANDILNSIDPEIDMDEYVDPDDTSYRRCPQCKSVNVKVSPLGCKAILLAITLLGAPLLYWQRDCQCRKCGAKWQA